MTTHNSDDKCKAVAALIELAVKGAVAGALARTEGAAFADAMQEASKATAHVMNLCGTAGLIAPAVRASWPVVDGPLAGQFRACSDEYFDYADDYAAAAVVRDVAEPVSVKFTVYRYRLRMYDNGTYCWTCRS